MSKHKILTDEAKKAFGQAAAAVQGAGTSMSKTTNPDLAPDAASMKRVPAARAERASAVIPDLVARIHAEHAEVESALRSSVQHAINCGELLIKAKELTPHGKWADWLTDNIKFSDRLAQAYMRLARLPVEKRNGVADLPLREALGAIRSREQRVADAEQAAESRAEKSSEPNSPGSPVAPEPTTAGPRAAAAPAFPDLPVGLDRRAEHTIRNGEPVPVAPTTTAPSLNEATRPTTGEPLSTPTAPQPVEPNGESRTEPPTAAEPISWQQRQWARHVAAIAELCDISNRNLPNSFINLISIDEMRSHAANLRRAREWLVAFDDNVRSCLRKLKRQEKARGLVRAAADHAGHRPRM